MNRYLYFSFLFFNDTATTEIYTLSLHDSLPIWLEPEPPGQVGGDPHDRPGDGDGARRQGAGQLVAVEDGRGGDVERADRKSTRLNFSHANISYAVFCLKKKIILSTINMRDLHNI